MKKKDLRIIVLLLVIGVALFSILNVQKDNATDIVSVEEDDLSLDYKLQKYEMIFLYPKNNKKIKDEVSKIISELTQIYDSNHSKLLFTFIVSR